MIRKLATLDFRGNAPRSSIARSLKDHRRLQWTAAAAESSSTTQSDGSWKRPEAHPHRTSQHLIPKSLDAPIQQGSSSNLLANETSRSFPCQREIRPNISLRNRKDGSDDTLNPAALRRVKRDRKTWQVQKDALYRKFGSEGWSPRKRLSPDALGGIRALHAQYPEKYNTAVLSDQFKVSPESIRRILKSTWTPDSGEEEERRARWDKRGKIIWGRLVESGIKAPKKWRDMGVGTSYGFRSNPRRRRLSMPSGIAVTDDNEVNSANKSGTQLKRTIGKVPRNSLSERIL